MECLQVHGRGKAAGSVMGDVGMLILVGLWSLVSVRLILEV